MDRPTHYFHNPGIFITGAFEGFPSGLYIIEQVFYLCTVQIIVHILIVNRHPANKQNKNHS